MCRPMGRRTETSMAPSSRRQRLATLAADRVIDAVLALATLSTSLGATACRGSGAHNICAGHGSCARLLAAAGARQPSKKLAQVVIGDERAASELARHEVSVADCGVHGISAEAGQRARLRNAVRAAASLGGVLHHMYRPALGVRRTDGAGRHVVDSAGR